MATKKKTIKLDVENPEAVIAAVQAGLQEQEAAAPAVTVVMDVVPVVTPEPEDKELLGKPFGQKWLMTEAECERMGVDPALAATPEELAQHAANAKKTRKGTRKSKAEEAAKAELAAKNQAAVDAAFAAAKQAEPVVTAALEAKPEPAPVAKPVVEEDWDVLNASLFGDDAPFYAEMLDLRAKAKALFDEGKAADLGKKRYEARREADRLAYAIPNQMGREIYNLLAKRGDAAQQAQFAKLERAFRDGTDEKLAKMYDNLIKTRIKAMGHADAYLQNLAQAEQKMKDFEAYEYEVNLKFEEGRKLFDQANEIAMTFGWPVTAKRENKGGEA